MVICSYLFVGVMTALWGVDVSVQYKKIHCLHHLTEVKLKTSDNTDLLYSCNIR